jgi:hypothetical protein
MIRFEEAITLQQQQQQRQEQRQQQRQQQQQQQQQQIEPNSEVLLDGSIMI